MYQGVHKPHGLKYTPAGIPPNPTTDERATALPRIGRPSRSRDPGPVKPTNGTPVLLTLDPDDDPDVDDVRLVAVPELDDELGAERVVACPDGCALGGGVRVGTDGLCPELEPPPDGDV